ncbi:MAG TPA: hypothetical protein VLA49_14120 [Anaerolineales bacterium]|nr:hypothetical protein [Anaerolineales bacterium]
MEPHKELSPSRLSYRNLVIKALLLFILFNLIFALTQPLPALGHISAYNHLFPGRLRLPYSDVPALSYNLSLFNLEAMFASHELTAKSTPDEYRIIVIGDSSTWGFLLEPDETLTAYINAKKLITPDGRRIKTYNLGYPVMSLVKDLVILKRAIQYQPDMIIWLFTLESFPYDKQLFSPLLQNNADEVRVLINTYGLGIDPNDPGFIHNNFWGRTIIGQRRALADLLRLQFYGLMWAATGVDQYIPGDYTARQVDLPPEDSFHNLTPPRLKQDDLALNVLQAGLSLAGDIPILLVNEPMFISQGENSQIRYNFYYPRWAYDGYREIMAATAHERGWSYRDYWDVVPPEEFTNTAIHLTPAGSTQLAAIIGRDIQTLIANQP